MKKITSIGYEIPAHSDFSLDFSSRKSLMDFDIIVFAPVLPYYQQSSAGEGYYLGKVCYGDSGSFKLRGDIAHWRNELSNALKAGKSVFLFLSDKEEFYLDTGSRSYSGSGRNRSTTVNVEPGNNYELLPTGIGEIIPASGKQILPSGSSIFNTFFEKFKQNLEYRLYLENVSEGDVLFTGNDKSKVLGLLTNADGGNLISLPFIYYDEEKFTENRKDKKGEEKAYWTKEATKFGSDLIECLLEIDLALRKDSEKTPPPAWTQKKEFLLKKEGELQDQISKNEESIKKLTESNSKLHTEIQEETLLKNLLFEQGKPLEFGVIKALKILGFNSENYDDGELELDQVIIGPEKVRCVGECEGKDTKDVNIDKLRQLVESLNADFYRDEVDTRASGILFGNAQRLIDPKTRTLDFTDKCKKSANREKIALVKTTDLFLVTRYLSEIDDETFKTACRHAIYDGFGKIVKFPPLPTAK